MASDELQAIIKHGDVELTLVNSKGDIAYVGKASSVRTTPRGKHLLRFPIKDSSDGAYPFEVAVIHSGPKHFIAFNIAQTRLNGAQEIQLSY